MDYCGLPPYPVYVVQLHKWEFCVQRCAILFIWGLQLMDLCNRGCPKLSIEYNVYSNTYITGEMNQNDSIKHSWKYMDVQERDSIYTHGAIWRRSSICLIRLVVRTTEEDVDALVWANVSIFPSVRKLAIICEINQQRAGKNKLILIMHN